jgi:hypothetical protein
MKLNKNTILMTLAVMLITMFGLTQTKAQDMGGGWYKLASSMTKDSICTKYGGFESDYCTEIAVTASQLTDSVVYARRVQKIKVNPLGTGWAIRFHVNLTNGMVADLKLRIFHHDTTWTNDGLQRIYGHGTWESKFFDMSYAPMTEFDSIEITVKRAGPLGQQVTIDLDNFRNLADEVCYDGGEFAKICGWLWHDANQNGIKDLEEKAMRNIKMFLIDSLSYKTDSLFTDSSGYYLFECRERGVHIIKPEPREFWTITTHASGESTLVINNNPLYYSDINFGLYSNQATTYPLNHGWNIISVPKTGTDMARTNLYPTSTSQAFEYTSGYLRKDTLETGKGYWMKFDDTTVVVAGNEFLIDTITVVPGWNLIGALSQPITISSIISEPGGLQMSQFWGYAGRYNEVDTLKPNQGYWVKVISEGGQLILNATLKFAKTTGQNIVIVHLDELPPPAPGEKQNPSTALGIPTAFQLGQNYPNPFNPSTNIEYQIMNNEYVSLKVFNILGQEVMTLVNEMKAPGKYTASFNGSNLTSGIYFYHLQAGSYHKTKKMVLMK